jgi:metalloendopeptidase OMA1, mitochondrial
VPSKSFCLLALLSFHRNLAANLEQEIYTRMYSDDGTLTNDNLFKKWHDDGDEAAMKLGRPLRIANKIKKWMQQAGFVDVHEEVFKMPVNPWPKEERMKEIGRV